MPRCLTRRRRYLFCSRIFGLRDYSGWLGECRRVTRERLRDRRGYVLLRG